MKKAARKAAKKNAEAICVGIEELGEIQGRLYDALEEVNGAICTFNEVVSEVNFEMGDVGGRIQMHADALEEEDALDTDALIDALADFDFEPGEEAYEVDEIADLGTYPLCREIARLQKALKKIK